jgi:DNA modification methylase
VRPPEVTVRYGDARDLALALDPESIDCIVTSPPYWGLRDYGHADQFGLEATPREYVAKLVDLFARLRPALKDCGTVWLNLGDCYATGAGRMGNCPGGDKSFQKFDDKPATQPNRMPLPGLKPKDLVGIPWRVAFALQDAGWYLRSDIIWSKPNPMPESVTDRPTKAHEYVFLMSKSARYWYDAAAIREADDGQDHGRTVLGGPSLEPSGGLRPEHSGIRTPGGRNGLGRNIRTVWTIPTQPYSGAHFAVFPQALAERCIKAGCPENGTVLDPFAGSGTTLYVARKLGRNAVGFELNEGYRGLIDERLAQGVLL